MAAAAVFEALEPRPQSLEKIPEKLKEDNVGVAKTTLERRPVPTPRRESLNDRPKWYSKEDHQKTAETPSEPGGELQDPFSFPPTKDKEDTLDSRIDESPSEQATTDKTTGFASLHKKYSPFGSKENLTEETEDDTQEKDDNKVKEKQEEHSHLLYENVLFKRSDSTARKSVNKRPGTENTENRGETKPESRLSGTIDLSTPLDEDAEWEKVWAIDTLFHLIYHCKMNCLFKKSL
jgi:hypothetical protein